MFLPKKLLEEKLKNFLMEDLGQGDLTSALVIPRNCFAEAALISKSEGIVAGIEEAKIMLELVDLNFESYVQDGDRIKHGQILMNIKGDARTILSIERLLLNLVSRMSGIATATQEIVDKIRKAGYKTRVACTRKTAPGMLYFDKKAVVVGGGDPHRLHLDDLILIKDNHIALIGGVEKAISKAKAAASFSKKIEVEVSTPEEALIAAKAGADIILLDNFSPKQVEETVNALRKAGLFQRVLLEASGGISAENVLEFASKGVDVISLGELTHSVKALDLSLEIVNSNCRAEGL
ncbi:carboxylating nicotinate-nucleotide diphosphorylase [Candidatus Bathyarchaeota archaeon]|nr:carboxylating nicotinate-nucleotide diphosphorylase [Candidatus Bathyarchaeota archaeon]